MPPNNLHKYAVLLITNVCHFKKNYVCPPQSVKKNMCAPPPPPPLICNCFLRACVACKISPIKIEYSFYQKINLYLGFFFPIKYRCLIDSDIFFLKKNISFIYNMHVCFYDVVTVCFAAVKLVIVLAWFL